MSRYRVLVHRDLLRELHALGQAAAAQPNGLRHRELRALKAGLRAIAQGREHEFDGKRLRFAAHDLSDCAEIKLAVVQESRGAHDLGPSHRLIYREFAADDGGPPYREAICFEHRRNDRPFDVAAHRLDRELNLPLVPSMTHAAASDISPIRQRLPPDLKQALAAAADTASALHAVRSPPTSTPSGGSPTRASHTQSPTHRRSRSK